jgi:tetratricopeptide (TPR) repeat protein
MLLTAIFVAIGLVPGTVFSLFAKPVIEKTPVPRLIENIEQQVKAEPENAKLLVNLARVHGMAYAKKIDELEVETRRPNEAWFGYLPPHVPFGDVVQLDKDYQKSHKLDVKGLEKKKLAATEHLDKAIETYQKALEVDPQNVTAQLGLAWALDEKGEDEQAIEMYRKLVADGWEKEKDMKFASMTYRSIVAEAGNYLIEKLDSKKDKSEIDAISAKIEKVSKIIRPISPIAIPLNEANWSSVYDPTASVRFDADGSGYQKAWTWIRPEAGWLVYDHIHGGKIDSALQLFGNVSFWCFWENGYQALRALDDNQDGCLRGDELRHLAIWQDRNQNGKSEVGEVRPLVAWGIVAIDCSCVESSFDGEMISHNPRGIQRRDGSFVPTFDVILHRADALNAESFVSQSTTSTR